MTSKLRIVICVSLLSAAGPVAAADAVAEQTYNFDGWVVTVRPGPSGTGSPKKDPSPVATTSAMPVIRPASFETSALPPAPAPMEDDVPANGDAPVGGDVPTVAPRHDNAVSPAATPGVPCVDFDGRVPLYSSVYNAIPFSRAEYDANPSYRHDATMEFLFGQMRPTVINRSQSRIDVNMPQTWGTPWAYSPYGFNSFYYPFVTSGLRVHRSW